MTMQMAVQTNRLSKAFHETEVLNHLDLEVKQGEIFGILGANGAGKTTLLKLIAGLLEPSEGEACVLGKNSWTERDAVLPNIGTLIETPVFYEQLSAAENLAIHLEYMEKEADIPAALRQVGLGDTKDKPVSKFSLGMRQRLGIARGIIHRPKVLLLDEPINGLDPIAIREMRELFLSLKDTGVTILLSSHILGEVTQTVERVAILVNGTLAETADMKALHQTSPDQIEDYLIEKMSGR